MPQIGTLRTLEVASPNITDGVWPHIAEMLNLREVHLRSPQVTGRGIGALTKLPRLRSLRLEATQVDIESLRSLESMPGLQVLELRTPSFGDADVYRLGGFQQLRRIELEATPVTATGAAELKRLLPDCMIVFTENGEKQVLN
jgi:hypothetical protein